MIAPKDGAGRMVAHAALLGSDGGNTSGLKSWQVTSPLVASSIDTQRPLGTPRFFHWLTSIGCTPMRLARAACDPAIWEALSIAFMFIGSIVNVSVYFANISVYSRNQPICLWWALMSDSDETLSSEEKMRIRAGNALRYAISRNGYNLAEFAELMNQSTQNIQNWVNRGTPKKHLQRVADLLKADREELAGYEPSSLLRDPAAETEIQKIRNAALSRPLIADPTNMVLIPEYEHAGGAMGHGVDLPDQPGQIINWQVTSEWANKNIPSNTGKNNLRVVTGFGDSMRPMFNSGDPLLVDSGVRDVAYDGVYFFRVGNEGFIKRLQRTPPNGILVISENPSYRDWNITEDMDFEVFGRVLRAWCGSEF